MDKGIYLKDNLILKITASNFFLESILYNDEKIRKTDQKFLFPKDGKVVELFKYSSKKSVTYFLYHNKLHRMKFMFDSLEEKSLIENFFFVLYKVELVVSEILN